MDSLAAPTKDELKWIRKRELRQKQEQVRKERIFNPRVRLIGIDRDSLDRLVEEKNQRKLEERNEEMCHMLEANRQMEIFNSEMIEANEQKLLKERELNEFRSRFQQKHQIENPESNSAIDDLEWLGADVGYSDRLKLQRQQQTSWLQQQIAEKEELERKSAMAEEALQASALKNDAQIREQELIDHEMRRKMQIDTMKYNVALTQAKQAKQMENKRHEEEDNLAEIMNFLSSDMLLENKEAGASSLYGGKRINPTSFRGMTDDQLKRIRAEQLKQIDERKKNVFDEKQSDLIHYETIKNQMALLEVEEQAVRMKRQQSRAHQDSVNTILCEDQTRRNHHMNSQVYKFTPNEEFYEQFNLNSR